MFINLFPGIVGLYLVFMPMTITTRTMLGAFIHQYVPFILGITGILITVKQMGWL